MLNSLVWIIVLPSLVVSVILGIVCAYLLIKLTKKKPDELTCGIINKTDLEELHKLVERMHELANTMQFIKLQDLAQDLRRVVNNIY